MRRFSPLAVFLAVSFFSWEPAAVAAEAEWSSDGSIVLDNGDARVVISPARGGRVGILVERQGCLRAGGVRIG